MSRNTRIGCVLVGGQTLLIQCGQELLDRGHQIHALISDDAGAQAWARNAGIEVLSEGENVAGRLESLQFDYLFSIVNLKISPDYLIKAPKRAAINFHDGPLPDYAGLNVTTWALLNGETEHAVTWHEMLSEVDEGRIFLEQRFAIETEDTALTLNARCFEAGLASFQALVSQIEQDDLAPTDQADREGRFFAGSSKPDSLGLIDWSQDAEAICRLVRALDYGTYPNPVAAAKSVLGGALYLAEGATDSGTRSQLAPGTIVSTGKAGTCVATGSTNVFIEHFQAVNPGGASEPRTGQKFDPLPDAEIRQKLHSVVQSHESFWLKRLQKLPQLRVEGLPVLPASGVSSDRERYAQMEMGDREDLALHAGFFSRLAGQRSFALPLWVNQSLPLLANTVPLRIQTGGQDLQSLADRWSAELKKTAEKQGFCLDLPVRFPALADQAANWSDARHALSFINLAEGQELPEFLPAALVVVADGNSGKLSWWAHRELVPQEKAAHLQAQFEAFAEDVVNGKQLVESATIIPRSDRAQLQQWNETGLDYDAQCLHEMFEQQAEATPDAEAVSYLDRSLSYEQFNRLSNQIAHHLIGAGVTRGDRVGVMMARSEWMLAAMMAVLKAGAAYVPLDPTYPADRIRHMVEDSGVRVVLANSDDTRFETASVIAIGPNGVDLSGRPGSDPGVAVDVDDLAYVIYTSGSTGTPKGVMVAHRNVANFFAGMDERIERDPSGVWLAVTSISFDISVLELFWTLSRGFKVVIAPTQESGLRSGQSRHPGRAMGFSLFFWNYVNDADRESPQKYRLLMEASRFADNNGFEAIWTPERHFGDFGGSYPNPSVISAALAATTRNVKIRAGSVVMPLHSPIRVAEDWSIVDNLSGGRVGLSFASGWQPNDFVIKPEGFENAKQVMLDGIETVRKLWRGESVSFDGPKGNVDVRTLPRPIQSELPVWVTSAGSPETFRAAGTMGANLLTHLLGQTVEKVGENLRIYREAWKEAGHAGEGHVTLMLHTLVGDDEERVKEIAREPMKRYLKSAMFLVKAAAWQFPTFKKMSEDTGRELDDIFANMSEDDMDGLLEFAFERYYGTSGLFGTPESCMAMVDALKEIGVNEIGCLVDYGLTNDDVLAHLPHLATLRQAANAGGGESIEDHYFLLDEQIRRHQVSHLQCTPSQASMMVADPDTHDALAQLKHFMIGGEALPLELADQVAGLCRGRVTNMYGPTETTIWSTTWDVPRSPEKISIGKPIGNTFVHIVDESLNPLPIGATGELLIAGDGVVKGYHNQPDLTAQRFPANLLGHPRAYRTGDRARFNADGNLECLGRMDQQVKVRGHRIELGEIESVMGRHPAVRTAAAVLREEAPGDKQLCAYYVPDTSDRGTPGEVKTWLRSRLPEFMVPSHVVAIDQMPLTPNGKIDRLALPAIRDSASVGAPAKQPQTGLESEVAAIWCRLLDRDQVGAGENFFEIGGHSLLAVKLQADLGDLVGRKVPITDIFRYPTVESFARSYSEPETGSEDTRGRSRAARRMAARSRR